MLSQSFCQTCNSVLSACIHVGLKSLVFLAAPERALCIGTPAPPHVLGVIAVAPRVAARHAAAMRRAVEDGAPAEVAKSFHGPEL